METRVETLVVPFTGDGAGEFPLTAGQRNVFDWLGRDTLGPSDVLTVMIRVPRTTSLPEIREALAALIRAHASLRTTFPDPLGVQRVLASGALAARVVEIGGEDDYRAETTPRSPFDLAGGLPLSATVLTRRGTPFAVVVHLSHAATDWAGAAVVRRDLLGLLTYPESSLGPRLQPSKVALDEAEGAGKRRLTATIRYWTNLVESYPNCSLPPRDQVEYAGHHEVTLRSPDAGPIVGRVADELSVAPSAVVLAALACLLAHWLDTDAGLLHALVANRFRPGTADHVGTLAQETVVPYRIAGASFRQVVREVNTSCLDAFRHGSFNTLELRAAVQATTFRTGWNPHRDIVVNNTSGYPIAFPSIGPRVEVHTVLSFDNPFGFNVFEVTPRLVFRLSVDARHMDAALAEAFARGVERLLLEAGDGDPWPPGDLAEFSPAPRPGGWIRLGSRWVDLPAVTADLRAAAGSPAAVFAVGSELIGYAATEREPGELHREIVAGLEDRHGAVAPDWYVCCANPPADLGDLDGWRRRPVRADGRGRAPIIQTIS